MKQSVYNLLCAYIYNNKCELEHEVKQLQQNVRFRRIDINDCIEIACALQRLETFNEVTGHIRMLFRIGCENV